MNRALPLALIIAWASARPVQAQPPPPPGFEGRRPLAPDDYQRKNERGYVTGLPLANYDPNTGAGFGARAYYYWNGTRQDPRFAYTPYLQRVFLQIFFTTGGLQFHWLDYDVPSIAGTAYRFRSQLIYLRNTDEHYFGLGSRAMAPLAYPGSTTPYRSFAPYQTDLERVDGQGLTYARYDSFQHSEPLGLFSIERTFLHGLLRPLMGLGFSYHGIHDYTGEQVRAAGDVKATQAPTRLHEDCLRGAIAGCGGGWDNFLRFGLSFDTRDFEPDPNRGVFVDAALDFGLHALGSKQQWARFLLSPRVYYSPIPRLADLVLAWRGTFQLQSTSMPFFQMKFIPWTEDPRSGLGGIRTLRGFKQDRFVGPVMTLSNAEIRWTFYRFQVLRQKIGLIAVPFLDLGAVWDRLSAVRLAGWKRAQGAALRISWNLATIITVDYGWSSEDSGLYINFNHIF